MNGTKYLKGECTHCGGHLEFPAESAGLTAECPHCGQTTELFLTTPQVEPFVPRKTIVWTAIAVVILGLGLALALVALNRVKRWEARQKERASAKAAPNPESNAIALAEAEVPARKAGFRISAITIEKAPGSSLIYAVGTVTNAASRQRFGIKLELDLFDVGGQKLGIAKDYQPVMEARSEWPFKALVVDSKAVTAKLAAIAEDK